MGQSPTSTLVFGIHMDEDEDYNLPTFMRTEGYFDMEEFIYGELGLNYDDHPYEERAAAVANYPVKLVSYSTFDDPMYVLSIPGTEFTSSWEGPHMFEGGLPETPSQEKIDELKAWAKAHGVPGDPEPCWQLLAMFG